jgi:hypothetical protein
MKEVIFMHLPFCMIALMVGMIFRFGLGLNIYFCCIITFITPRICIYFYEKFKFWKGNKK